MYRETLEDFHADKILYTGIIFFWQYSERKLTNFRANIGDCVMEFLSIIYSLICSLPYKCCFSKISANPVSVKSRQSHTFCPLLRCQLLSFYIDVITSLLIFLILWRGTISRSFKLFSFGFISKGWNKFLSLEKNNQRYFFFFLL